MTNRVLIVSIYRVNCVRIDSKDEFAFLLDTDATDVDVIESQAKSDALKQQAEVVSILEEQASMNFAQTLTYVSEQIWNSRHPERAPLEWESEYLVKKMLDWLSEEDSFKSVRKEVDIFEEYGMPLFFKWNDELEPMVEFLKKSLTGLDTYFENN
jgi:hypothetical protein